MRRADTTHSAPFPPTRAFSTACIVCRRNKPLPRLRRNSSCCLGQYGWPLLSWRGRPSCHARSFRAPRQPDARRVLSAAVPQTTLPALHPPLSPADIQKRHGIRSRQTPAPPGSRLCISAPSGSQEHCAAAHLYCASISAHPLSCLLPQQPLLRTPP